MTIRKIFASLGAVVASVGIASAANLPLLSGPQYSEPSQVLATINTLIQNINSGVGGLLNAQTGAYSSIATTVEQTMLSYTVPASAIASAGQALRVKCWGGTAASANNKTMKLYFGAQNVATPAAGTSNKGWYLEEIVMNRTGTDQGYLGTGLVDTTAVTPIASDATETLASGVLVKCTGTQGAASTNEIIASGMIIEQIK